MTARERWYKQYRLNRVLQRELRKAQKDQMVYGQSVVVVPKQGDPYHIPALNFWTSHAIH